jgi:replication factor C large subunit
MPVKWTEKYRPGTLREVLGNNKAVEELRHWAACWEAGRPESKAAIAYGPAGVGKTSAALALARELDWDAIEMNASDIRTAGMIQKVAGPASWSSTFSGHRRLIILDEADNLHGTADRGGAAAMLRLARETGQPLLLIANEYYEIEKPLRDASLGIQFRSIRATTIAAALREICRKEGISCDPDALELIADRAGGDIRSAINDLQAAAEGASHFSLEDVATAERDVRESIFKVLEIIFKGSAARDALQAAYTLDESPEDLVHWVDENLPLAYQGEDLFRGYESLARSDIFLGRVRRRQVYGLWRYASYLMTGGVQAARAGHRHGYIAFRPPGLWRRLAQSRRARGIRDSAAKKIGGRCHVSAGFARAELMGFIGLLLKDKETAIGAAAELDLDAEEIALLIGSTPSTKKVQSIFEEAQKLKLQAQAQEIDLAWRGQPTSMKAKQAGSETSDVTADVTAEVKAGARAVAKEGDRAEAREEKKTAGRTEIILEPAKPQTGKRQKSLFDFDK